MTAPVSTYGWDVVFATRTSVVNAGLADPGPQPFDETVQHAGVSVHALGSTGRWQVTVGGSGALVNFTVPCSDLTMSSGDKKVTFDDGQFEVQGELDLRASDGGPPGSHDLVVRTGPGAVTVLVAAFPGTDFDAYAAYATAALQAWLDAQTSLPYVLATVGMRPPDATGLGAVLTPVAATYAYVDAPTGGGGVLGILGAVSGGANPVGAAPGSQLLQEVSPDAVAATDTVLLVNTAVLQALVTGAASSVTLPGTSGSSSSVPEPASFPVVTRGPE